MQLISRSELVSALDSFLTAKPVGVDVETNAKEVFDPAAKLVTISFAGYTSGAVTGYQIPIAHREGRNCEPDVMPLLTEYLQDRRAVAFWLPMEVQWMLSKMGIRLQWVGDAYIIGRIAQLKDFGLKDLTRKELNREVIDYEEVCTDPSKDYSTVHAQDLKGIKYTTDDGVNCLVLEAVMRNKYIDRHSMGAVYELEVAASAIMAEQTLHGYQVDLDRLDRELKAEEMRVKELESGIFSELGTKPFSINSGVQLGKAMESAFKLRPVKFTEKGAPSWSQDAIEALRTACYAEGRQKEYDVLAKIVEWKSRFSTINSLRRRPEDVCPDGCIHPKWKTIGADGTARIYGESPSPTSLPKAARRAMPAPEGKRWVKFDWKQAEMRILAALSGDEGLLAACQSSDFHSAVWALMTNTQPESVTPEQREASKVVSYSMVYSGGSPYYVAEQLRIPISEGEAQVRAYFARFPKLKTFLDATAANAVSTRHVRSHMNRLRRLEGTDVEKIKNQACNSMGQQSCGTLLKVALSVLYGFWRLEHPMLKGLFQIIPVFDAMFYCIDADVPMEAHLAFMQSMVTPVAVNGVKLEADFEVGNSWGEMSKVSPGFSQAAADFQPSGTSQ